MPRPRKASGAYRGNQFQLKQLKVSRWRGVSVPMVAVEHRQAVSVLEPRGYKARRFYIQREVELAKYGFSDDCEGCRVAQLGAEAKPHIEGCRDRIRQAMMNDESGPATRVEVAQECQDEAMSQAPVASSAREASGASGARNVKPRVGASQEDSTGVSSRMEDVLPSRKRGSEEMRPSDDPNLTPADESMGIREMAVILLSLGMAPANFKVAESFCRNGFGEAAVSMGFEHGLVLDYATGWNMSNEEQNERGRAARL